MMMDNAGVMSRPLPGGLGESKFWGRCHAVAEADGEWTPDGAVVPAP